MLDHIRRIGVIVVNDGIWCNFSSFRKELFQNRWARLPVVPVRTIGKNVSGPSKPESFATFPVQLFHLSQHTLDTP